MDKSSGPADLIAGVAPGRPASAELGAGQYPAALSPVGGDILVEGNAVGTTLVSGQGNIVINRVTIVYGGEDLRGRLAVVEETDTAGRELGPNPYRGLEAFDETSAAFFFGREALTRGLLNRVADLMAPAAVGRERLLAVMGPSGSGKSSVARAGLVTALARTTAAWLRGAEVAVLRPGASPVDALAGALARLVTGDRAPLMKQREFATEIRTGAEAGRPDALSRLAMRSGTCTGPLIVLIDQFEETYTLCRPADTADGRQVTDKRAERDAFVHTLLHAAAEPGGRVCVVLTLRSDFYGALSEHPVLSKAVAANHEIVPAMDRDDFRRTIAEPARKAGHPLDSGTVERVLDEAEAGGAAALPMVQYALFQIWEEIRNGSRPAETLTKLGGVGGALAGRADQVLAGLPSERERALAQRAFLATVQPGEGARDTRRRAWLDEVVPACMAASEAQHILKPFADERLLTMGAVEDGRIWLELPHEALIRYWHTLREWVDAQREDLRFSRHLQEAAERWHERQGDLWQGIDLHRLEQHALNYPLTTKQADFLAASLGGASRRRWMKRSLVMVLVVLALGGALTSAFIWNQSQTLRKQRDAALVAEARSIARQAMDIIRQSPETAYLLAAQGVPWPGMGSVGQRPEVLESRYALDIASSLLISKHIEPLTPSYIVGLSTNGDILALSSSQDPIPNEAVTLKSGTYQLLFLSLDLQTKQIRSKKLADVYVESELGPVAKFDESGTKVFLVGIQLLPKGRNSMVATLSNGPVTFTFGVNPFSDRDLLNSDQTIPASLNEIKKSKLTQARIQSVAAGKNGTIAAVAYYEGGGIQMFRFVSGKWDMDDYLATPVGDPVRYLRFSQGGRYLYGISELGSVFLWKLASRPATLIALRPVYDPVEFVTVTDSERVIIIASRQSVAVQTVIHSLDVHKRYLSAEKIVFDEMPSRIPNCPSVADLIGWGLLPTSRRSANYRQHPNPNPPTIGSHICTLANGYRAETEKSVLRWILGIFAG